MAIGNKKSSDLKSDSMVASTALVLNRCTFSQELYLLAAHYENRPTQFSELIAATHGRGFYLLLLAVSLPFVTPVPLPGLSTPFGLVAAIVGFGLALGQKPWLPQRLLSRQIPPGFLNRTLKAAVWIMRFLERLLQPRLALFNEAVDFRHLAGLFILVSGVLLLLPLPVPFSNSLPALTIVLLSASAVGRDGAFFLAGCGMGLASLAYFVLLAFGGIHVVGDLQHSLTIR